VAGVCRGRRGGRDGQVRPQGRTGNLKTIRMGTRPRPGPRRQNVMGRKSNFYKAVDGAMAEWKQDLLAEAKALTLEDVEALAEQLREVNEHFRALQSEAEERSGERRVGRESRAHLT